MAKSMSRTYNEVEIQSINIINKGTKIVGDIVVDGDIRIDGNLKGNINAKGRLVIGSSGLIEGEIVCNDIEVSGEVKGKIDASELLTMKSPSKIFGEIYTKKLIVEPGSIFTGNCKMGEKQLNNISAKNEAKEQVIDAPSKS